MKNKALLAVAFVISIATVVAFDGETFAVQESAVSATANSTSSTRNLKNLHPIQAELVRELKQLERTQHVMEVAYAKNPSPHRKAATDHVQSAISEIKAELKANSKTPGGAP